MGIGPFGALAPKSSLFLFLSEFLANMLDSFPSMKRGLWIDLEYSADELGPASPPLLG